MQSLPSFTQEFISESLNEEKNVFVESLDQFRRLEVREKVRNAFLMSLRMSDHKVLHNMASSLHVSLLDFARIFLLFLLVFRTFQTFGV